MRKFLSAMPSDIFPDGKMKYFLRKCEILLPQYEICLRHIAVSLRDDEKQNRLRFAVCFSLTFSKKKFHRQSLFHTPSGVFHRFAKQIYIIACWTYPYAQHAKRAGFCAVAIKSRHPVFRMPAKGSYSSIQLPARPTAFFHSARYLARVASSMTGSKVRSSSHAARISS